MLRDLHDQLYATRGISPVSVSDNTPQVSQIFDTAGYGAVELLILLGSLADADATFTVLIEDGAASDLSDNVAVDDAYLLGIEGNPAMPTGASFRYDSDNKVTKIGYIGPKRYVRATITPANNASASLLAAVWVGGFPRVAPKSTQMV